MGPIAIASLRRGIACLALLALVACASTPMETLRRLQGWVPSDLARAEPAQVRVALKLPLPARPEPDGAELAVKLDGGDVAPERTPLAMTLVNEGRTVRAGSLPTAEPGYWWYLFKLTPAAEDALRALQLRTSDAGHDTLGFRVSVAYANVGPGQSLSREIRLQLAEETGFHGLTDGDQVIPDDTTEAGA